MAKIGTPDDFARAVGRLVRAARLAAGLSLKTVQVRTGLSKTCLYDVEAGRSGLGLFTVWRLAAALGVPATDLIPKERPET